MGWADYISGAVSIERGDAESRRFGMTILNVRCGEEVGGEQDLGARLADVPFDLAVVRFPSGSTRLGMELSRSDWSLIVTDPTVYWGTDRLNPRDPLQENGILEEASTGDSETLRNVIESSFRGYQSHWHHNPLTAGINMADAYIEWTESVVARQQEGAYVLRTESDHEPIGMVLLDFCDSFIEVLLAGIASEFQGRGHYSAILAGVEEVARGRGVDKVVISTQASNINVQKAWSRWGWLPTKTIQTVHLTRAEV